MITIWFLMALMAYPHTPAILYKGYGGFLTFDECESKRIITENMIANIEIQRGNTVYIETYCMEFEAFESQLEKKKELDKNKDLNSIGFEA
jgi:hypothetical protein